MQIMIDIDDKLYGRIFHSDAIYDYDKESVVKAIVNGTPLPKGHGDIVDIETLCDMFWDGNSMEITKYDLSVIEPIIEAYKAESEDKE